METNHAADHKITIVIQYQNFINIHTTAKKSGGFFRAVKY